MRMKSLVTVSGIVFFLYSFTASADVTKMCNDTQKTKCTHFCMSHKGMKSCMLDITKNNGMCTCTDGTMHMKKK